MSTEDESWREHFSEENTGGREGYRPNSGRTPRPRIARPAYSASSAGSSERPYRPRVNREGGAGSYSSQNYRSREGNGGYQREGGYQPRESRGYQSRGQHAGYQSREQRGGYQRNDFHQREESGYQPRERRGGYQSREQYGNYQPREQREGYQPRDTREGGYQPRERGGYQQRGYQQGGQGYGQRRPQRPRTPGYDPNAKYSFKKRIEYAEANIDPNQPLRLNKFLANAGVCSRREADDFIQAGVVSVNGQIVTELGTKVLRSDTVLFHDQLVTIEKKVYVLLNKPKDYVTTSDDPQNRKTVMDLVQDACRERIYPVGRLDRNTTGVLLLTNDGDLASKLTHPQYLKKKIYHVYLDKNVTAADLRQIADGIQLEDGEIHADAVEYASETDKKQVGIEIHSGRNRIVRRIFEHLGYHVVKLDRVFFAGLTKKNLRRGDWRYLTEKEVNMLRMGAFE